MENKIEALSQNKKNRKGKTVAIIILVLLLLGAIGYIIYNNFIFKDTTTIELEEKVKQLNKTINTLKKEKATNEEQTIIDASNNNVVDNNNYVNAAYGWTAIDSSTMLILFNDGKCIVARGWEYNLGTYTINNDKIMLKLTAIDGGEYAQVYTMYEKNNGGWPEKHIKLDSDNNIDLKKLE